MGLLLADFCWGENALADQLKIVTDLEQYLRSTHHDLLHDDGIYVVSKSSQSPTEAHGTDLEFRYTRTEAPFRAGLFYCCNGVGSMIGGILSYGIGQIDGFPVWKAVFLVCGGMTVLWGVVLLLFLPDSILSARFFSLEEKALLIARARLAKTGVLNKSIKWNQIREVFLDAQVWILILFVLLNEVINGGVANFGKLIMVWIVPETCSLSKANLVSQYVLLPIRFDLFFLSQTEYHGDILTDPLENSKGLVGDPLRTTALGIPQGAFQVIWILSGTFIASKFKNCRTIVMACWLIPTIIGVTLMWKIDRKSHGVGVLFGYYLVGCYVASLVLALQMPTTNIGGYTKRITASGLVFLAYCVGNIG